MRARPEADAHALADRWHLYVAECSDLTLYVGIAKDVAARLECHNAGRGAKYTRTRRPVRLVYSETVGEHADALRREREVKRWSRPDRVRRLALGVAPRIAPGRRSTPKQARGRTRGSSKASRSSGRAA
jgi:putative endonuclease